VLRRVGRGLLVGVLTLVPVVVIAVLVRERFQPLIHVDDAAIRAATDVTRAHPALLRTLLVVQAVMQPVWVYLVAFATCAWVWARGLRSRALWAVATMLVGWFLGFLVKLVVQRARPVVSDPVSHSPGYSFPSGHAFNAALALTVVSIAVWPLAHRAVKATLLTVGSLVVVVTCLDRVFLGVHFPSDVVGGVILALALAAASWTGYGAPHQVGTTVPHPPERS